MTNLEIDILKVMSYSEWMTVLQIEKKLKVECNRKLWFTSIHPYVWRLENKNWLEYKREEGTEKNKNIPRYYYRKCRNGRAIPEKQLIWNKLIPALQN
jgi:DNA-binding PadR family transcriptional regulator